MKVAIRWLICFDEAIGLEIASLHFPGLTKAALLKLCNVCLVCSMYGLQLFAFIMGGI